jgi:hypothetical protein
VKQITTIGFDLAKQFFQDHAADAVVMTPAERLNLNS